MEAIWQSNDGLHFAPVPDSRLIWIAKPKARHPRIYVESQTICLPLFASVVACIGQHAHFQERKGLQFFVTGGKAILLEEKIACLFDDILQRDKAGLILFQAFLQAGNGFLDRRTVFACRSLLCFRTNEAIGENGLDQLKRFLALRLLA